MIGLVSLVITTAEPTAETTAPPDLAASCVKRCRGVMRAYLHHFPWSSGTALSNDLCSYEIDSTRLFA